MWHSLFTWLGVLVFINYLYDTLKSPLQLTYHKWLRYQGESKALKEKYGKWAAITGSTDGIGKAYARELARHGLNIVLISRSQMKLEQVAEEIEKDFGVETFIIRVDFSKGPDIYEYLFKELAKKPSGILVNNVGVGHNPPGRLHTFSHQDIFDMININVGAATLLSRHFIEHCVKNNIKGCLVNVSSGLELCPVPYGSVYGASKAYLRSFTLALQHEAKPFGIRVQLVAPCFVVTKINNYSKRIMKGNYFIPSAKQYAKWAVNSIDKIDVTTGYFYHGIQISIVKLIPWRLCCYVGIWVSKRVVDNVSNL